MVGRTLAQYRLSEEGMTKRIIMGITGATGAPLAHRVLELMGDLDVEVHLLLSKWGMRLIETETGVTVWSATNTEDSASFWSSLFGTGQKSSSVVMRNCIDGCLDTLMD